MNIISSSNLNKSANSLVRVITGMQNAKQELAEAREATIDDNEYTSLKNEVEKVSASVKRWEIMAPAAADDEVAKQFISDQLERLTAEREGLVQKLAEASAKRDAALKEKESREEELRIAYNEKVAEVSSAYTSFLKEFSKFDEKVSGIRKEFALETEKLSDNSADAADVEEDDNEEFFDESLLLLPDENSQQYTPEEENAAPVATVEKVAESKTADETVNEQKDELDSEDEKSDCSSKDNALYVIKQVMKRFHNAAAEYDNDIDVEYSRDLKPVWSEVKISSEEKRTIADLYKFLEIKGLDKKQTYVLKCSLPTELLNACGLRKYAEDRAVNQENYYDGYINNWRPAFTYGIVSELYSLVERGASAEEIDKFITENQDCKVKSSRWPYFEKNIVKAFANVSA